MKPISLCFGYNILKQEKKSFKLFFKIALQDIAKQLFTMF